MVIEYESDSILDWEIPIQSVNMLLNPVYDLYFVLSTNVWTNETGDISRSYNKTDSGTVLNIFCSIQETYHKIKAIESNGNYAASLSNCL